jgi:hypothetical protein
MVHPFILILIGFGGLVSCSGFRRPSIEEAKTNFLQRYPEAGVIDVRISEDEVVARSFEFTYRRTGDHVSKKIDIQFMESDTGSYEMRPSPPDQLP